MIWYSVGIMPDHAPPYSETFSAPSYKITFEVVSLFLALHNVEIDLLEEDCKRNAYSL